MGARDKLNRAHLNGALVIAGVLGLVSGSAAVFVTAAAVLVASSVMNGGIRLGSKPPNQYR